MTTTVPTHGGAAVPASIVTDGKTMGRVATRVYGFTSAAEAAAAGYKCEAGPASSVYVVSAAELASGKFIAEGDPKALPMYAAPAGMKVEAGYAQPIVIVGGGLSVAGAGVTPWYLAGGLISESDVVAAYQAENAPDVGSSLVSLVSPGINSLIPGNIPDWDAVNGWKFDSALSHSLSTGIYPTDTMSIVAKISNIASGSKGLMLASYSNNNTTRFELSSDANNFYYCHANFSSVSKSAGTIFGIAGQQGWLDGAKNGGTISGTWSGTPSRPIYIGWQGAGAAYGSFYCQKVALFSRTLSDAEMVALYNSTLPASPFPTISYNNTIMVAFGDSIAAGTGASDEAHRWANIVAATRGYTLVNSGIASTILQNTVQNTVATIGAAADNNGRDTYMARVQNKHPGYVYILYGLNDLRLNDAAITSTLYQNDLNGVVGALVAAGINAQKIVIGSPPYIPAASYALFAPWDGGSGIKHAVYVTAAEAVATYNGTRYADIYQYMTNNGGDALISGDGIHPNDAGHAAIAAAFLAAL